MNKEKIIKILKNPWNVLFIILLITTTIIYSKDLFVDSIWLDETNYTWQAQLMGEDLFHFFKMDMYELPVTIIYFFDFFFPNFIAGRLMGLFFGLLGVFFIFWLGKKMKNSFVGFTAALLLAFHHWYRFLTMKALVDVPMTAMIVVFAYFLYKFEDKINIKNSIILLIIGLATISCKASGIFVVPLAIAYLLIIYIFFKEKRKPLIKKLKRFKFNKKNIIIIIILLILIFIFRSSIAFFFRYKIFNFLLILQFNTFIPTLKLLPSLLSWIIIILSIVGLIITIFYKSKKLIILVLPGALFLFFALFFYNKVPELRYILPILPFFYLASAIVIDEMTNYIRMFIPKFKKIIKLGLRIIAIIILFLIVVKPYYVSGNQIIENKNYAYTGYIEAMNWVSDNIKTAGGEFKGIKNTYIPNFFACCGYNVGLDRNDIRRINWSGRFDTFEEFKSFIKRKDNVNKTFYLMPDMWETGQRSWLYPMTQEKFNNIVSLKFNLVKVVERPYPTQEGIKNIPVIFIFRRN